MHVFHTFGELPTITAQPFPACEQCPELKPDYRARRLADHYHLV